MFNFSQIKNVFLEQDKKFYFSDIAKKIIPLVNWLKNQTCKNVLIEENRFIETFFASIFAEKELYFLSGASKKLPESIEYIDISDFKENNSNVQTEPFCFDEIDEDNIYLNFCTSGSTSTPKIIKKTLKNMFVEAREILEEQNISDSFVFCKTTKFSHLFGATFGLFVPLLNGNPIQIEQIQYPEQVDYENFVFVSTPAFLSRIEKYNNPTKHNPELIITAGDKLDEKVYKYFENKSKILEIYGSTETGVLAYKTNYNKDFTIFKNVKINLLEGNKLEIFSNFFNDKSVIINDKIEFSGEKTFKFLKRSDRILKINEKRINAIELEEKIIGLQYIKEAYCLKIEDKLCCIIVLEKADEVKTNEEIIKNIKNYLSDKFEIIPQKWRFLPEIPKTETGKIDIEKIKKIFDITLSFPVITGIKREKDKVELVLKYSKNSNFFKGHFPKYPILPGVVQVCFAKFLAEFYFDINVNANEIKKLKFSKIIVPEEYIILYLTNKDNSVLFEYKKGETIASSAILKKEIQVKSNEN